MHCVVHSLSHRKGVYDETSDYIMNIVTSLVLNRRYNVSQNNGDIMDLRNMTTETIARVTKGDDVRTKRMICRINNQAYVAPGNDKWRHENSSSDNEEERMGELSEKKTRWWFEKEKGKKKKNAKDNSYSLCSKETRPSIEPQQRLVDETMIDPSSIPQDAIDLTKATLEQFIQLNEAAGVAQDDSSEEADSEATVSESELDLTTLGRGKAQLKKKPTKRQKASDEEDSSYVPDEPKKQRAKCKAVQARVIPRRVRAKKTGAELPKDKDGKKEKHVETSKVQETEKAQNVEIPKEPEVQNVEIPEVEVQKNTGGNDDYVEITGYKAATPPPPPQDQPESSHQKDTSFDYLFEGLPTATRIYKEDIPEEDYDMFNNEVVKELMKKVAELEKEKAKAEVERDVFKTQIEELMKAHDEARMVLIDQEETIKKMKDDVHDNSQLFKLLSVEIASLNVKIKNLQDVNQTLNQLLSEMSEASSNEIKVMKLEMEAMKADKVMKDNQLNMLYAVFESHLKNDVHAAFNETEVKRVEERRIQRERELAQEATQRRKAVVVDAEAGTSSSVADAEMTEVEADLLDFVLVGESSESLDLTNILHRVHVLQKKKKAREVLMLEWKKEEVEEEKPNFILIGKASSVPYNIKQIVRQIKIIEDDSDKELFGDEEEDEDDNDVDNKSDKKDDEDDKKNDDDRGSSGLPVENPNVQQRIEEFLNDEINKQEDDLHHEASTSGKQHVDQVILTNPTVIYLNAQHEGEIEIQRSRA
ncbi:hypothetical protein Hanom_Chr11g01025501 [Helianthus anomalus]